MDSTASRATRASNSKFPPAIPTPPTHSPPKRIGQPPSIAVQFVAPAASFKPSACATSRDCPCAPFDPVGRRLEAAHTALVVAECTVWKRPPSMRSRSTRLPPESAMATVMAMPASSARAMAVAIIFFAPAAVRRLVSATYMVFVPLRTILMHARFAHRALPGRGRRHRRHARLVCAHPRNDVGPASGFWISRALDVPGRGGRRAHRAQRQGGQPDPEEVPGTHFPGCGRRHGSHRSHRVSRHGAPRDARALARERRALLPAAGAPARASPPLLPPPPPPPHHPRPPPPPTPRATPRPPP